VVKSKQTLAEVRLGAKICCKNEVVEKNQYANYVVKMRCKMEDIGGI
jgi:hypothetical protein